MAEVRPLRGIRYVQERVGDTAQVVSPPYDVINKEDQQRYYERSTYNIIRLELGKEYPNDTLLNNRYTRAAATLAEWRLEGILREEPVPCYYLYQQVFHYRGQQYTRTSLMARVRVEPWEAHVVLPHEHTLAKAKDDRLQLLRASATNFSPIMSLYDDPQGRIRRLLHGYAERAEIRITDEIGEEHILQPIRDEQQVALIQDFFAERQLYIADGHHRYETALNYRNEILEQRRELHPEDAVNFVLMALIDVDDPGMLVLPTHRMLFDLSQEALARLADASKYFTVETLDTAETGDRLMQRIEELGRQGHIALVVATAEQTRLLVRNEAGQERMQQSGHSAAWNTLDVAVAQSLVLEDLLGLSIEDMKAATHVCYTRDAQQALEVVQTGVVQVAVLLNATQVRQIRDVAEANDKMPQKSTYFYPKLITGLVMNPLW